MKYVLVSGGVISGIGKGVIGMCCARELRMGREDIYGGIRGGIEKQWEGYGHMLIGMRSFFDGSVAEDDWT
ncbi:hypothetical protein ONS95_007538 [Cadophora gregata]|uniref:uncharacterized protein n=1 Tax=Cadophora gregata TaxID=51156 RepID=UPI0026DBE28A|nr:uncharacterized protein ONS95_007538 [Cadophora gregata]KAK0118657.1 hypothetical protein ONS96_011744 [Cadophora gregata f. sp. sojae]KAK0125914.1 hypothetical protein ONS95_007538 [Cadophora gregata]